MTNVKLRYLLLPCGADISASVENGVRVFADEMLQLQISQVIKHFAKSKQRSDTFYMP